MTSTAPGTVIVISATGIPAPYNDSAAKMAISADETRIPGMIPISLIRSRSDFLSVPICAVRFGVIGAPGPLIKARDFAECKRSRVAQK
jgi:hypothetical protein